MTVTRKNRQWTDGRMTTESLDELLRHIKTGAGAAVDFSHFQAAADMYAKGYINRQGFVSRWYRCQEMANEKGGKLCAQ